MVKTLVLLMAATLAGYAAEGEAERLKALPARFQQFVDAGELSGGVFLVARHGKTLLAEAVGFQDVEARKPMRVDSIFQMMSMTKPVTAVALMMLVDEGRVALTDPVEQHLPEFRGQMVAAPEGPRKPLRPVCVRDLLSHTAGIGMPPRGSLGPDAKRPTTLAEAVTLYAKAPLRFDPGTKFAYSNAGIATAGRIVEVVSGMPYEKFLEDRLFRPLGMKDTFFFPDEARLGRIAVYYRFEGGKLRRAGPENPLGDPLRSGFRARYPLPESGLYSTAPDMAAFHQMMLDGGTRQGKRILSRSAVEVMAMVHTGALETREPGFGWGLGWNVAKDPWGSLSLLSPGTFAHGGAWNTYGFVDRSKDMIGILMLQHEGSNERSVREFFNALVNAAVDREVQ